MRAPGSWDATALTRVIADEFDFLGPWVRGSVSSSDGGQFEDSVLTLTFSPPAGRDLSAAEKRFTKASTRAERGDVEGALEDFEGLTRDVPEVSKYWRALGHAWLVRGAADRAEDALLKSLALNPLDPDALTLLGNLYAHRGDTGQAIPLYRRSLTLNRNVYALTNVAAMLAKAGEKAEAERLFREAVQLDPSYPNAWYALGLALAQRRDLAVLPEAIGALERALTVIEDPKRAPEVWTAARGLLGQLSGLAAQHHAESSGEMIEAATEKAETVGGLPISTTEQRLDGILAKVELGWPRGRTAHRILVQPGAGIEAVHLIRHELEHIVLSGEARQAGRNRWFVSDDASTEQARRTVHPDAVRIFRGTPAHAEQMSSVWISGILGQLYNAPVDMLIESRLQREHPEFRELWFFALSKQLTTATHIAESKEIAGSTSRTIYRASNAMNGALALWFEETYPRRTDFAARFSRTDTIGLSRRLYASWKDRQKSWTPGAELDWVDEWAELLGIAGWYRWTDGNA